MLHIVKPTLKSTQYITNRMFCSCGTLQNCINKFSACYKSLKKESSLRKFAQVAAVSSCTTFVISKVANYPGFPRGKHPGKGSAVLVLGGGVMQGGQVQCRGAGRRGVGAGVQGGEV